MNFASIETTSQTYVSRGSDLIFNSIDDEIVILSIKNEEYYYLNTVGSTIWKYIAEPESIENIINKLTEEYKVSVEVCRSETIQYIEELFNLEIINLTNE